MKNPQEQLRNLDNRLGVGIGATKERTKLQKKIGIEKSQELTKDVTVEKKEKFKKGVLQK